jgi:hypothetical protein
MATINFSVPDDVKVAFNEMFCDQNKSAIITELMREAVGRAQARQRSRNAITNILSRREAAPVLSEEGFRAAREDGRS